jgi:hypothetical protein
MVYLLVLMRLSFLLVRHPGVMEKLRSEIAQLETDKVDRSRLLSMHYLQNVLKESKSRNGTAKSRTRC